MSRGLTGSIERSWSGAPGTVPWTWALYPFALLYAAGSALARSRAKRRRRRLSELRVVAIGGLTVGGSGKSSVANWMASRMDRMNGMRTAVLLRGHRATRSSEHPYVVPDFARYPMSEASARGGDEAAAHRSSLMRSEHGSIPVAAHRDRYASAKAVHAGYGAHVMILDDGWEQPWLQWDELWAVVDPDLPAGNGALLPAGPLRRPVSSLREANVVALVFEDGADVASARGQAVERIRSWAPDADIVRFRRTLDDVSPLGDRDVNSVEEGAIPPLGPAGLVSGIGAPERLERFARATGIRVVSHAAFPDHASWTSGQIESAVEEAARRGAEVIVTTEKDEARWPVNTTCPLPVRVLRTRLEPLDSCLELLGRAMGAISQADLDRARPTRRP